MEWVTSARTTTEGDPPCAPWQPATLLRSLDDGTKANLRLVEQESYANGIQKLCYDVVR